eukprot:149293-Rhodomonas_salina.1
MPTIQRAMGADPRARVPQRLHQGGWPALPHRRPRHRPEVLAALSKTSNALSTNLNRSGAEDENDDRAGDGRADVDVELAGYHIPKGSVLFAGLPYMQVSSPSSILILALGKSSLS